MRFLSRWTDYVNYAEEGRVLPPSTVGSSILTMEPKQRIMIRAEVFWQTLPANRSIEHPA